MNSIPDCIKYAANPDDCPSREDCVIFKKGLCKEFIDTLHKIINKLKTQAFEDADISDMIGSISLTVISSIGKLRDDRKFRAWIWKIFENKKKDKLREKYKERHLRNKLIESIVISVAYHTEYGLKAPKDSRDVTHFIDPQEEHIKKVNFEMHKETYPLPNSGWILGHYDGEGAVENIAVEEVLEYLRNNIERDECAGIIMLWYVGLKSGKTSKEVAEEIGMKPNSFIQKKKRCLGKIRQLLRKSRSEHA